jgi:glyoxylase-like metal-dependent hydrolase (beta-lactamase superfamily II)
MIFVPMWDGSMGCASFLFGDEALGQGMVVDPLENIGADSYILSATELGLEITAIVETHVHADHHSAARELAEKTGLMVSLSHRAPVAYAFNPLSQDDVLDLGHACATVWETPGHTPDSISLVITDSTRSNEPWFVLSGDSLFVGDVGRPDLVDPTPEMVREAALEQFHSIHEKILTLPDTTELYPAHYGASACGGLFLSPKPVSTIGFERRWNRFAQISDPDQFVDQVLMLLKPPPESAAAIRAANLGVPTLA